MSNDSIDSKQNETSSDTEAPTLVRRENSPSIQADGPVAKADATIHDRTGLYLAIIAVLFSAMAFGMTIMLPMVYSERTEALKDRVAQAEQTAALAREDVRIMQNALAARGIQTDVHEGQRK